MVLVAVRVLAAEAAHRIELIRLEVGCAGIQLVGMFLHPRAGDVVLARAQRRLVQPARLERSDHRVLGRLGRQHIVGIIAEVARSIGRSRGLGRLLRSPGRGEFQLQTIHNLLRRVAGVRPPFDQPTLKRRTVSVGILWFAVDRHRQPRPATQWPGRPCIAQAQVDHRVEQSHSHRAIGQWFSKDDPALMIARAGFDQPGQLKPGQTRQRHLGAQIIEHQEMAGGKLGFARLERTIIPGIEARATDEVVSRGRKIRRHLIGATGRPSTLAGVAALRARRRKRTFR